MTFIDAQCDKSQRTDAKGDEGGRRGRAFAYGFRLSRNGRLWLPHRKMGFLSGIRTPGTSFTGLLAGEFEGEVLDEAVVLALFEPVIGAE